MIMILGMVIVFLASFVQGLAGFGFALIAVPLLSRILPLQTVVPIIVCFSFLSNIFILVPLFKDMDISKIKRLVVSSLIAAPLGTYLLIVVHANVLKLLIGVVITIFAILLIKGYTFPIKNDRLGMIPVGFASGLLNGSISFSGPPVVLFLSNQGVEKNGFRANLSAYALLLNLVTIGTYLFGGLITKQVMHDSLWLVIAMMIGVALGNKVVRKMKENQFRKLTLALIMLSGAWTILSVLHK